jgi:alpha-beta hydrolase superfamily lysophospholipase
LFWLWTVLGIVAGLLLLLALGALLLHRHIMRKYLGHLVRIFQERPLFVIPRGQPAPDAEDVSFRTSDQLNLRGCYLRATGSRRGVVLFGLEFGSNRWACVPYCDFLRQNGFDIFAFETRGQGDSDRHPGYEPLQWVTDFEVRDFRAALDYLKKRADADPNGVGFFGISKGAGAGLLAATDDPYLRCFVTDGVFATHTTMVPYMRKWIGIYSDRYWIQKYLPVWYYGMAARIGLKRIRRQRDCRFPHLEYVIHKLAPRPLLMIHGEGDTYIKPEMAEALFELAAEPKELWFVEGAKHNQSLQVATDEYQRRVLAFFDAHLAGYGTEQAPGARPTAYAHPNGQGQPPAANPVAQGPRTLKPRA